MLPLVSIYSFRANPVSPHPGDLTLCFCLMMHSTPLYYITANELDAPLNVEEIKSSIKAMQNSKSPGPDGFPVEFLKKFINKLAPLLNSVFNESLEHGSLPPTLTQASISLLLKKGKDPVSYASYRPLSLLDVDVKILSKTLATRLEKVLPIIISEEQNGFIKGQMSEHF